MTTAEVNIRILLALAVILAISRLAGWLISKVGQPRVHGEILAGLVLGSSVLGLVWPEALNYLFPEPIIGALRVLAQLGVVLFMFLIGLELNVTELRGEAHKAVVISLASILVPILLGGLLGLWLYPRIGDGAGLLSFTLFIGAAMAITAFPVLARVLQETGLDRTRLGVLAITCAAVDDVTAWCLLAVVVAVVQASAISDAVWTFALSLIFLVAMFKIVKPALARMDHLPMWLAIFLALLCAWITEEIGIHAIFGAFLAGAVMPRGVEMQRSVHERLAPVVVTFLLPVFFVVVGLATRVALLDSLYLWGVTLLVICTAIAGKWGGSAIAARLMGETWRDAASLGILMNTRGLTELVILTVGLQLGVINSTFFTMGVLMALVTTLMATPLLSLISPLYHRGMSIDAVVIDDEQADASERDGVRGRADEAAEGDGPSGEEGRGRRRAI